VPEIARPEKEPQRRAILSVEKSRLGRVPEARRGRIILLACHIHPHSIIHRVTFSSQIYSESGVGVDTPNPRTIGKGLPLSM
jgi:hypothetical protein